MLNSVRTESREALWPTAEQGGAVQPLAATIVGEWLRRVARGVLGGVANTPLTLCECPPYLIL